MPQTRQADMSDILEVSERDMAFEPDKPLLPNEFDSIQDGLMKQRVRKSSANNRPDCYSKKYCDLDGLISCNPKGNLHNCSTAHRATIEDLSD